jgi:hypothetical protein
MAKRKNGNVISIGQWMLLMLLTALPCVGIPVAAVGAFVGDNDTRKNYCRAILLWYALALVLWFVLMAIGSWPHIQAKIMSVFR